MKHVLGILGIFVVAACSSSGGGPSGSSPDPSQPLVQLSSGQRAALCDSLAPLQGGYGHGVTCLEEGGTVTISFWQSEAQCTGELALIPATCPVTVAQETACVQWTLSCTNFGAPDSPDCDALAACTPTDLEAGTSTSGSAPGLAPVNDR